MDVDEQHVDDVDVQAFDQDVDEWEAPDPTSPDGMLPPSLQSLHCFAAVTPAPPI